MFLVSKNLPHHLEQQTTDFLPLNHSISSATAAVQCPICGLSLKHRRNLKSHMAIHDGRKTHHCTDCPKSFLRRNQLDSHRRSVHIGERSHECTVCWRTFSQASNYRVHMRLHVKAFFNCPHCPSGQRRLFATQTELDKHRTIHIGPEQYRCPDCGKTYKHRVSLRSHRRSHCGKQKLFECRACGKYFVNSSVLAIHMRTHTGAKPYRCEECGKGFSQWTNWIRHNRQVHVERTTRIADDAAANDADRKACRSERPQKTLDKNGMEYACALCGIELRSAELEKHVRQQHAGELCDWYDCPFCELKFTHRNILRDHLREHESMSQNEMQCSECGILFRRFSYYKKHKCIKSKQPQPKSAEDDQLNSTTDCSRSSEVSPIADQNSDNLADLAILEVTPLPASVCPICGKILRNAKALRMHMPTHSAKRYQCEYCPKRFVRLSQLETHQRTHTGDRPYECTVCSRRFAQSVMVQIHMRTHTGQKPFQCVQCDRGFAQAANLKRHEQQMHAGVGAQRYDCGICGQSFQRKFTMQSHEKRHEAKALKVQRNSETKVQF